MDAQQNLKQDWTKGWPTTRQIPHDAQTFTANGREYRVSRSLSFERYEAYELLQVEVGLARTFEQLTDQIKEAYSLCNQVASGKPVFADLAVLLRDMLIGTQLVGERETPAVLKLCALFINRENEDVRKVDEGIIESKINDWRQEGIDIRFFFAYALNSIPGYIEALRAVSRDTSSAEQPTKAPASTSKPASKPSAT